MKQKRITKKDLLEVKSFFAEWYGLTIPFQMLIQWSRTVSYDDVCYFDTISRESLADFVANKLTGMNWPMNGDESSYKKKFYKRLVKNARRFKVKVDLDVD